MWTCRLQVLLLVVSLPFLFCAPANAQYLNDPYVVANSGGGVEWWSDAAYNPARNEYGMTWQNGYVIKWRRLDSTGAVLGSEFAVADGVTQGHHYSVVCYNSARAEYLILYSGWMADNSDQMRLVRVDAITGNQIGGTIYLDSLGTNSTTGGLDIAYSATSNSYIAVYESYAEGNVYGRILDAFGNPTGSRFQIDTPSQQYSRNPQVTWNSVNNEYLVTFMGLVNGPSWDYWAQRISASNGALLGSSQQLTTTGDVYTFGGVAYDSNANRYLVVYDGGSSMPYGQLVSNTATLVGARFAIGAGTTTGWSPAVCYDSLRHEFLVSWSASQSGSNYSIRVSQAGVPIGTATDNTGTWATAGTGNWPPRPVYNSVNDEFLIHWHNSYTTILDRRYKSTITQTTVSINLGFTNIEDMMTQPIGGDGDTVGVANIGGRECRQNMDPAANDFYFYFAANDAWAFQGSKPDVWIYCDYWDAGTTGSITLNYDATSSAYKDGGTVYLTNTNSWKTQKWHVTDAYFGNRENNGGDFRIYVGNVVRYLDQSTVNQNTPGTTPPGQASAPSPAGGATGVIITPTLLWTAGANTTTSNVFFGTTNPPPFAAGTAGTSYIPGTLTVGTTYYWRIDEYRSGGGTTNGNVWSFTTLPLPGLASSPSPANSATGVAITASLSWTAGSNTTSHDVRFGTANPPPFIQNQAGTSYSPGTMAAGTTYYWRIDEKNGSGTTTGTVWSFTTLPVPGLASSPSPANGATGVSISPTLTWTAGSNATSHDVRFGTANPPPFIQNQAGTSYATGSLSGSTVYYWRIDEKNSSGTTTGTVWSFTTASSVPTYFVNSSFESGFGAAGGGYNGSKGNNWTPYVYTGVASDLTFADETGAGNFDSGFHSQKITAGAGKEGGVYNQFSVVNGNSYTVTVRCKSGSGAGWLWFGINTSGGTDPHEASGTIYPANNNRSTSWTTFTWTGTATGNLITLFLDTYDGVGYWDTSTPGPVTVSNSAFASSADGWNIVVWHTGPNLDGTMAFESGTGNPAGDMLSGGSGGTNNTDSCTREGGEINKAISTSGYPGLVQVQYDLRFNTDQSGPTCIGGCTVLEGDCADKIAVYYSTAGTGGPWTLLEKVNASALTQNVWSTRTINCPSGANNQANFALRFRFQFNTVNTDWGRLDNIKVIGTP